ARHRVILLGLAEQLGSQEPTLLRETASETHLQHVLEHLPPLRGGMTTKVVRNWPLEAKRILRLTAGYARELELEVATKLKVAADWIPDNDPGTGGRWQPWEGDRSALPKHLADWLHDPRLGGILNHEVRSH